MIMITHTARVCGFESNTVIMTFGNPNSLEVKKQY